MVQVTIGRDKKFRSVASFLVDAVGLLHDGNTGHLIGFGRKDRIGGTIVSLEIIIDSARHDRADRMHIRSIKTFSLPSLQTSFNSFRNGNGLCDREGDRCIDGDTAIR